jgi:hypothetical protein
MPIDLALIKHTLAVLANVSPSALPADTLAAEVEIRANRPLTTQQVADALSYCRDLGVLDRRRDDFGRDVWWITEAGKNKLRGM